MRPASFVLLATIALVCLMGAPLAEAERPRGTTALIGDPLECTADVRDQVTTRPPGIPAHAAAPIAPLFPRLEGYIAVDSVEASPFVTAGDEYAVKFDCSAVSLADSLVPYELTPTAWQAIEIAPTWLQKDLEWNFHHMTADIQNTYANLLLGLDDERTVDEVAFQIAHLSWLLLTYHVDPPLLEINAELMYQIDPDLSYVEIVDYDLGGGEFYSTTRYRTIVEAETTLVEIPRETYYLWIVMPKLSDEKPLMDGSVYDMFWREYLYYEHDSGYPLLQEVMQPIAVLWDGEQHTWPGARAFSDSMLAVDAVGNWVSETVPNQASGNRPIQPNIIAHEHNGNCGELQDLLCAAARTCLIPTVCTMDILEDHVWCEMWLDIWHPYQVNWQRGATHIDNPGVAGDVDHGGSKEVSCVWDWRNDGYTWDVADRYSDVCTLTVYIDDPAGVPVDNAKVTIASEFYYPPYPLYAGSWGETGQDGEIQFILGNNQDYYVRVVTSLGNYPPTGYASIITGSVGGNHYYWNWTTANAMRQLEISEQTSGSYAQYVIEVEYALPYDVQYGRDTYSSPPSYYAQKLPNGRLDSFIVDRANIQAYLNGDPFDAYEVAEGLSTNHVYFHMPAIEDYFVVLSGAEHHGLSTLTEVKVRLWERDPSGVPELHPTACRVRFGPNPFGDRTTASFQTELTGPLAAQIYDSGGRLVRTIADGHLEAGAHQVAWDGMSDAGIALPSGVYYLRLEGQGIRERRRMTLLR